MSDQDQFFLGFLLLLLGFIPLFWHLEFFFKLEKTLTGRLGPIWGKYDMFRKKTAGSAGALPNLKYIVTKYGPELNEQEWALLRKSRLLYYVGGAWALIIFAFLSVLTLRG